MYLTTYGNPRYIGTVVYSAGVGQSGPTLERYAEEKK